MGKEARNKDSKKTEVRTLLLSERDRFHLLQWQNAMAPEKGHGARRQLDGYFEALRFDDFLTESGEIIIAKLSTDLESFPLENMMLDYMKDQLEKDAPPGVMVNVHTQRAASLVRDRIVKLQESPKDDEKKADESASGSSDSTAQPDA
jgi:hypothetical protein